MARAQTQTAGAITVWMIVFAFFWLVSTVWLVILYTGQEELRGENARLRTAKLHLISPQEEGSIDLVKNVVDRGPTAIGLMEAARGETARLATGEPADGAAVVRTKRDELLRTVQRDRLVAEPDAFDDVSLLDGMTRLYEAFKGESSLRRVAEDRAAELEAEVGKLVKLNADQQADFENRAADLTGQLSESEASHTAYRTGRDGETARLEKDLEQQRTQSDADLTQERKLRAAAEKQVTGLRERNAAQQDKFGGVSIGLQPLTTARRPDGKVIIAVPGDDIVYIDLGAEDRLTLGLQFAVYPGAKDIPPDGRAKALIEVVSLSETTAEAKIVKLLGPEIILEGDQIANPIYDVDRPPSFLVLGEFDLNRDGRPDRGGAETIESMISTWGGKLTDDLNALTDFVVLGAAPPPPKPLKDPSPEEAERLEAMKATLDRYTQTVEAAKGLSIPIMTQDVFLNFLGRTPQPAGR